MLAQQPFPGALDQVRIDVADPGHVGKLHQAVGRQPNVGRGVAEPVETAAEDLEGQQALVAHVQVLPGLGLDLRLALAGAFQVIQGQHVGIDR